MLKVFDPIFFKFGRFVAINELIVILTGNISKFFQSTDVISPSKLYEKLKSKDSRGLVSIYFFSSIKYSFRSENMISKNAKSEFYCNLSIQALSKSNDKIFDAINWLSKNLNNLMIGEIHAFENKKISIMLEDFDRSISVENEQPYNNKKMKKALSMILETIKKMIFQLKQIMWVYQIHLKK